MLARKSCDEDAVVDLDDLPSVQVVDTNNDEFDQGHGNHNTKCGFRSTMIRSHKNGATKAFPKTKQDEHMNDPHTKIYSPNHGDDDGGDDDDHATSKMPFLFHLAKRWAWIPLQFRCETHPEELSTEPVDDFTGDTVLRWVVFGNPPVSVVETLLKNCPLLAQTPNFAGVLPLHVACSYRAPAQILACLVHSYPEAAGRCLGSSHDRSITHAASTKCEASRRISLNNPIARYPLHILCDYGHSDPDAFYALLSTPMGVQTLLQLDPLYNRRPLSVWNFRKNLTQSQRQRDRMRMILQRIMTRNNQQRTQRDEVADDDNEEEEDLALTSELQDYEQANFWKIASVLIVAEYEQRPLTMSPSVGSRSDQDDPEQLFLSPLRIVRAAVSNPHCPPSLQEYAVLVYHPYIMSAKQCTEYRSQTTAVVKQTSVSNDKHIGGSNPLHWAARYATSADLVLDLLQICPPAAASVRDQDGYFPLCRALQNSYLRRQVWWSKPGCWSTV